MLEFKVCIPEDKTEQILQLFKQLNISYEPILPSKLSEKIILELENRIDSSNFDIYKEGKTFKILLHPRFKKELHSFEKNVEDSLNDTFTALQNFASILNSSPSPFPVKCSRKNPYSIITQSRACCTERCCV